MMGDTLRTIIVLILTLSAEGRRTAPCDAASIDTARDSYRDRYQRQPNIVYIMADDLGWNDVGFHNPKVRTPNIDALRAEGIELTQSYMQPVCSASRSAFMTGKYPSNNGLQLLLVVHESRTCLPTEHKTIFEYMKEEGYVTKQVGKWHLGYCARSCLPEARGVDEFRGITSGEANYFNWTDQTVLQRYVRGSPNAENIGTHLTIQDTRDIQDMILDHKGKEAPLFMWITPTAPHTPLQNTQEMFDTHNFLDSSNLETRRRRKYLGLVSALDNLVGQTRTALKDAGLNKNTIIIFSSDNGGAGQTSFYGSEEFYANNYPLRNGKSSYMEGGIRIPTIYYDPRLHYRTKGTDRDFLVHVTDWLPTFVHLGKLGKKPNSFKIPGLDGVSQLANLGSTYAHPQLRKYHLRKQFPVALGDVRANFFRPPKCATKDAAYRWRDYKLIYGDQYYLVDPDTLKSEWPQPEESPDLPEVTGDDCHRIVDGKRVVRCLFNVKDDPNEMKNLFDEEPEIVLKIIGKIKKIIEKSVKPVYNPPMKANNITVSNFGEYLVPRHDYCTPAIDFPLVRSDAICYQRQLPV